MRALARHPAFWIALAVKVVLGATAASSFLRDLFVPFVNYFVESGFANPWSHFAALDRLNSFPYPPIMLYVLAVPRWVLGVLLPAGTDTVTPAHLAVMRVPLLAADLTLAGILLRWFPHRRDRVLWFYWCSPFVVYVAYWHGQLDLIPTALFAAGLALLRAGRLSLAFAMFGIALGSKSHLLVALPFVLVYAGHEVGWLRAARLAGVTAAAYAIAVAPYVTDPGFRLMVYGSEEQARLFALRFPLEPAGLAILLAPTAIALLWLRFASYRKRNWDLLMLYLGLLFCVFVLLAPPRPGYFLWSIPFLVHFICRARDPQPLLHGAYAATYLGFFWLGRESDLFDAWRTVWPAAAGLATPHAWLAGVSPSLATTVENLLFSALEATLACLIAVMYLLGVRSNEVYRQRTAPVLVGVAGDSGSGKRVFARLVTAVLGEPRTTVISGDDYHRWPRGHEMYKVFTHLNASANDLHLQREHALALSAGKAVVKGTYEHVTGRFSEERLVEPGEYVVFTGLHALAVGEQRALYDFRIFLDPDERLRRLWKVRRDSRERAYDVPAVLAALDEREQDRQAYVLPQREHAELVVCWWPAVDVDPAQPDKDPPVTLRLQALNGFDLRGVVDALRASGGITVEYTPFVDTRWQRLALAGTIRADVLARTAEELVPNLRELTVTPRFEDDLPGCLQLVFLACVSAKLRWRRGGGDGPVLWMR
ncbi:MAG: hypothetical protein HYR51_09100 [Candidatus Rokubacteria bacterium]|nr:hypothetical protein [Candidatus Rokubacteria bacterium]